VYYESRLIGLNLPTGMDPEQIDEVTAGLEKKIQKHVRRPAQDKVIQKRAKDPDDELELIIVQSMLLTGFDPPPLHTMYVDKPMRGAALMQALARVNRTFRNKRDGLLVGYAPLTDKLYQAPAEYTAPDQNTKPMGKDIEDAVAKVKGHAGRNRRRDPHRP
jgi:type I restriction enzyme R subunit